DLLIHPEATGNFPGWQHGLPLAPIAFINGIKDDTLPADSSCRNYAVKQDLCNLDHPMDFNPDSRWGEARTWEHKDDNHVYGRVSGNKMHWQSWNGPSCDEILNRQAAAPNLDIKMEGA